MNRKVIYYPISFIVLIVFTALTSQVDAACYFPKNSIESSDDTYIRIKDGYTNKGLILKRDDEVDIILLDGDKKVRGAIENIEDNRFYVNGRYIEYKEIKSIRKSRTRGIKALKAIGLLSTLIGIASLAENVNILVTLFGFILPASFGSIALAVGLIILALALAFQSQYIRLDNEDAIIEVKKK